MAIQEYFRTSVCLDAEQVQNGNPNLPGLKKLIMAVCKNLNRYGVHLMECVILHTLEWIGLIDPRAELFCEAVKFPASCQLWRCFTERSTNSSLQGLDQNKLVAPMILCSIISA